jgi:hypothetical protein
MGQTGSHSTWPPWWAWGVVIASIPSLLVVGVHLVYLLFALLAQPYLSSWDLMYAKTFVAMGFVIWTFVGAFVAFPGSAIAVHIALIGTLIDKRESKRWPVWAFLSLSLAGNLYFYVALRLFH